MTFNHHVSFKRNKVIRDTFRANCTCGWLWVGSLAECQLQASTHNQWEDFDPTPAIEPERESAA